MTAIVTGEALALEHRLLPTNLTLEAGRVTCLIGPNGSGKTSLLHALAGIGRPEGRVLIEGLEPRSLPPAMRCTLLSFLPASRDIAWPLTGRDLVALGLPPGNPATEVDALLEKLDLGGIADRRADRLSTGERSRLLIARALAARPRLLLLDEPTANLDPLWQLLLTDQLRERVRREGCAMLVALHDLELARSFADRLLIMNEGRIEADGTPAELLAGDHIPRVFGIERAADGWRPVPRFRRADRPPSP